MKCSKCGTEVNEELNFCPNCGNNLKEAEATTVSEAKIVEEIPKEEGEQPKAEETSANENPLKGSYEIPKDNNQANSVQQPVINIDEDQQPTILCIASLAFYFLGPLIGSIIVGIGPLIRLISPLIGIGIMIYVRVKFPNNTFGKVLMILYIVLTILIIIAIITLIYLFKTLVQSCAGLG